MVNKKAVIIVTIITIILLAIIIGYFILKLQVSENIIEEDLTTENNYLNNVIEKDENNNSIKNVVPDKEENTTTNETNSTENDTNTKENTDTNEPSSNEHENENTSSSPDKLENGEDTAINLAKKKWNKDDKNVYYYVEEQLDHDIYVISVRNKSTTASIIQYEVNITTEEVTEY